MKPPNPVKPSNKPCAKCGLVHTRCAGHRTNSSPPVACKNWPIRGGTVCAIHGGRSRHVKAAAARRLEAAAALEATATYGLPRDVDPQQALLEELHRTAGHVAWLGALVAGLEQDNLKQLDATRRFERPSVWVELYQQERNHYAKVAKAAIDAGIEERRVKLAESYGELLAGVIRSVLADVFGLLAAAGVAAELLRRLQQSDVPDVVRRRLLEMAELNP